jgi:hypothetical protein
MICDGGAAIGRTSSSGRQIMQGARGRSSIEGRSSGRPSAVVLPFLSPASGKETGETARFYIQAATDEFFGVLGESNGCAMPGW